MPDALPLAGLRVLDLTRARAGPTAVRQLADWGADALMIEPPVALDRSDNMSGPRHGPDSVPGRDLVRLQQAFGLGRGAEGETHIDDVRRLRALVSLIGLDRLDLVAGAGIGIELIHLETVGRLEAIDDGAVAAPVMRHGDDGELTLLLRRRHQIAHGIGRGRARQGADRQSRGRRQRPSARHCSLHSLSPYPDPSLRSRRKISGYCCSAVKISLDYHTLSRADARHATCKDQLPAPPTR